MDVEQTMELLLGQQTAFPARMGELRGVVHELAVNQVALGKAQVRFDSNMSALQQGMAEIQENAKDIQERQRRTEETVRAMGEPVDRLVEALEKRFTTDGSGA